MLSLLIWKTATDEASFMGMTEYRAGPRASQPTHPGAILREDVVPALHLTVKEISEKLGVSRQALHAILGERAAISVEMAVRLGKFCGNGPSVWLRMQQAHDLWKAERDLADIVATIPTLRAS
jgi:addiction module HigA family antidote